MIPKSLNEWNLTSLTEMLDKGFFETALFDYKEMLPRSNDNKGKIRLRKECCAFANSNGGFLVFGIVDDKALTTAERLKGIDAKIDFPAWFGEFPMNCEPAVYWEYKNPAIKLNNGNHIWIVEIPKSYSSPHSLKSSENIWVFPKRTNKGVEYMSIDEIRGSFLGYYEKKSKIVSLTPFNGHRKLSYNTQKRNSDVQPKIHKAI